MDCPNYGDLGVISAATAFVESSTSLYIMRFLLGAAEAGFFPWCDFISNLLVARQL